MRKNILIEKTEKQLYSNKEKRFLADRFVTGTCPVCGYEEARGDECPNCGSNLSPLELINPRSKITGDTPVDKRNDTFLFSIRTIIRKSLSEWINSKTNWKQNVSITVKAGLKQVCGTGHIHEIWTGE